ncbi:MAG TPA: phosphatase domain-containing protein [Longimicrobiales bacterium]|nr:phosphatase domain-containing protein [Longimicrobiales bacterium]
MGDLRRALHGLLAVAEARVDDLRGALRRRGRGGPIPVEIHLYGGHGNSRESVVRGRVLESRAIPPARPEDPAWRNLLGALARLDSDEVPGAVVRVRAGTVDVAVESDEEGYFEARFPTPEGTGLWRTVEATLASVPFPFEPGAVSSGEYQVPSPRAEFGVISDLDDTVLQTEATSLLRMARRTLMHNAHTRLAFRGVGAFYRALRTAQGGSERPFFYVSSSPWNLYDLLAEFLDLNDIPRGTLLLKDYGLTSDHLLASDHVAHKLGHVFAVMDAHRELDFVLIGDSGQDDASVYATVVADRPGRVRAVYLRDVGTGRPTVHAALDEITAAGVPAVLGTDTESLARSAAEAGLVAAEVLEALAESETPPPGRSAPVVRVPAPDLDDEPSRG